MVENINGLEVINAFNREDLNSEIFMELSDKYRKEFMRATRVRELFFPMAHGVINGIGTIAIYMASLMIITHDWGKALTLGAVVMVSTYMNVFSGARTSILNILYSTIIYSGLFLL